MKKLVIFVLTLIGVFCVVSFFYLDKYLKDGNYSTSFIVGMIFFVLLGLFFNMKSRFSYLFKTTPKKENLPPAPLEDKKII